MFYLQFNQASNEVLTLEPTGFVFPVVFPAISIISQNESELIPKQYEGKMNSFSEFYFLVKF